MYVCICIYVYRGRPTGIYTSSKPEACHFVANSSRANIIVVENVKQREKILKGRTITEQGRQSRGGRGGAGGGAIAPPMYALGGPCPSKDDRRYIDLYTNRKSMAKKEKLSIQL